MLKEFRDFAFKGNVIDMAVGIIIGGAFGTVVKSLVDHVLMPPLGMLIAGIDFTKLKLVLSPAVADRPEVAIAYGQFLTNFISFLLLAFAVFVVVKKLMAVFHKKEESAAPAKPSAEAVLLTEIRDLLQSKS